VSGGRVSRRAPLPQVTEPGSETQQRIDVIADDFQARRSGWQMRTGRGFSRSFWRLDDRSVTPMSRSRGIRCVSGTVKPDGKG